MYKAIARGKGDGGSIHLDVCPFDSNKKPNKINISFCQPVAKLIVLTGAWGDKVELDLSECL
jgi:hypothetical protein